VIGAITVASLIATKLLSFKLSQTEVPSVLQRSTLFTCHGRQVAIFSCYINYKNGAV
jgi:hypothetical protein